MAAPVRVDAGVDEAPESLAELYHEETKYAPHALPRLLAAYRRYDDWRAAQPFPLVPAKRYPHAPRVPLPRPARLWAPLARVLARRRTAPPAPGPLRARDLATVLDAAAGVRADGGRHAPSAGGLYPLEWYVAARDVEGVPRALWHFDAHGRALERIAEGGADGWLLDDASFADAAALVVVTAVMPRLVVKYGERAYRFALLETGHAAQNALLAATARGLAAAPIGGYYDDRVHDALGLDGVEEIALYVLALGARSRR